MESLKNVISSFELKKELNPKMWVKGGEKINPSVRRNLLEIAYQFIDSFGLDVVVDDIVVTGSIANYNWSKYSDVDLHILIDYKQFKQEMKDLYVEFFDLKKIVFNEKRQLTMFGYDVEVYVEDNDKQGISGGVYSIMRDEWIIKPKKDSFGKANMKEVKEKAEQWMRIINEVLKNIGNESPEEIRKIIKKYKDKLKKYRVSGLEKGGEMSIENLVFKTLRRNGYIERLYNIPTKLIDKKLSLKEAAETIPGGFSVDLDMGPTYHSSRKLGNWESDNAWDMFAPVGTEVYSYTKGKVSNKKDYGSNSGKIYGIGVVIKGTDGYPDIFYTHIKNVDIEIGDTVDVGDYIGEIAEWPGNPGGEHVHIGLPYGEKLEDYISGVNPNLESKRHNDSLEDLDSDEFDEIKNNIFEKKPELEKNDDSEILKDSKDSRFMKDFLNMSNSNIDISEEDEVISYNSQVEKIQIALQFLDYLDLNYGIDGFYDEKTINAMNKFRDDFDLPKSTNIKKEDLLYMYFVLLYNLFDNSKLYKINKIPNYDELELTTINNFYQMVLIWLNADITYNNINFLNAWNDATIIGGEQNPFGLPFPKEKTTFSPILNTLDVLNLPEYSCVKAGLLQNKKSKEILNCRVFDKDNLREKIKNFLHK